VALLDHVVVKARTLVDAENAVDATDNTADDTTNHGAERTGGSLAIARAAFDPAGNSLGGRRDGQHYYGYKGGKSDKSADHVCSNGRGKVRDNGAGGIRFRGGGRQTGRRAPPR
jgi:hypothetical protein